METIYATRADAIAYAAEVIENGQALADEYNLDKVVDECFEYDPAEGHLQHAGYRLTAEGHEFWASVERHAYTEYAATFDPECEHDSGTNTLLRLTVTNPEGTEIERLQYLTTDPEAPEDLDDLASQLADQGWKIIETPADDGAPYLVARI